MANKKFLNPINLVNLSSDPSTASEGDIYYNTTDDVVKVYANSAWVAIGSGGGIEVSSTAPASPATGDAWYKNDTGEFYVYDGTYWVEVNGVIEGTNTFNTISVSGQSDVVADSSTDTLTLVAGTNVSITTDATNDSITINADSKSTSSVYLVRNNTGSTILKGTLVSASGAEPSGRIDVEPFAAVGGINSEITVMGMATANISNGVNGEVISFGTLTGIDTRGSTASAISVGDETWAEGDILFAHPTVAGKLTNVRPQHDLAVAFITVRHASAGQIAVRIVPGNNHLEWMHDVTIDTPADNEVLAYDTATSQWINQTAEEADILTSSSIGSTVQEYYADLSAISALTETSGILTKIEENTWILDTNIYVTTEEASLAYAEIDSPQFTGTPTAPTAIQGANSTQIATTEYVDLAVAGGTGGPVSIIGTLNEIDVAEFEGAYTISLPETVVLPSTTSIGSVTGLEISYLSGLEGPLTTTLDDKLSLIDAQTTYLTISDAENTYATIVDVVNGYQPLDSDLTAIAAIASNNGYLKKAGVDTWVLDDTEYLSTSDAASTYLTVAVASTTYATSLNPFFTGTATLPSTTSIGDVSATEISYLDGVTSPIQTQIDGKEDSHDHPYQTANASLSSIAALAGTAGFIKFDGGSTYTVDSNTYLVRNQPTVDTAIIAGTTTFSIANAIATTLNIGGAATAITIGSTNANAETIIRTPKINSNASSIQLFNATSTTIEFAGAATTLHVGGTSTAGSTFNIATNATASGNQKILNLATGGVSGSSTIINVGSDNDGTVNLYGDVMVNGTIEVPTPTSNAQAANKGYVDALAAGINIKEQASYATTIALDVTYTAGTSDSSGGLGIGATITATSNGALSPDGTEVVSGERVLVKNQTDAKQNGIYTVTDPGDGDSPFILTRAADFNGESTTNGTVKNGDYVFITGGSTNSNASFVISQSGTSTSPSGAIKFGTDNVLFSQYSGVPGNITSLGVVTVGVWNSTRIQKEFLDDELATLANPTFTGSVTVPEPVVDSDAANKQYVDDSIFANAAALPDIIPIDDIRGQFNGIDSRFQPKFQGETLSILNPLRLLLSVNGIIQTVDFPEYVWQSFLPREGFMVDSDGYIAFSEVPPAGSTFDARLMPGPNINSVKKGYPFKAVDILLGV
jgi:hypothetical protein